MLEAQHVSLVYRSAAGETYALREINLTIQPGEFVVLRGPSGSGKSSLLYILSALKPATAGRICFGQYTYGTSSFDALTELRRTKFGFIFQFHFLISYLTVLENVLVNAPDRSRESYDRAVALIEQLQISESIHRLPSQISGGQRQRVAIARALIHQPQIIFADEPTASLNTEIGLTVMRMLALHRGQRTVVMVTHDDTMARFASRLIELRDGQVVRDEPQQPAALE
ncbi:MAG: ABC transporter ATP-binding protein [Roseiflexaceae bacterium]